MNNKEAPNLEEEDQGANVSDILADLETTNNLSELQQHQQHQQQQLQEHHHLQESEPDNDTKKVSLAICRERSTEATPVLDYLSTKQANGQAVAFVVGPEGGWSPREVELFDALIRENPESIQSVSLGSTVLRSETACLVSASAFALVDSNAP